MYSSDNDLEHALNFDPLDAAEQIMGRDTESSVGLGLLLAQGHARAKERLLTERDDTVFNNTVERYLRIVHEQGFETVLCSPFKGRSYHNVPAPDEFFYVLASPEGFLLKFDTYNTIHVNSATVYYNWVPNHNIEHWRYTSSGGFFEYNEQTQSGYWCGNHDAREALIYNLNGLRKNGKILGRWVQRPFLWLLNYSDTDVPDYDFNAINETRISQLPAWVQTMITPEE